ncbi:MAG: methyltransferase, partial [Pseudomonas sp.]
MLLAPQQLETDQALLQLGKRLWADGYRFTCVSPATHARVIARHAGEPASTLRDVFGWSRPFAPALICADELEPLQRAQVLTAHTQLLRSNVRWSNYEDLLLVHSAYPTEASDAVFFGPDSYRFAQVIRAHLQRTPQPVEHAVDIGCGTGIGALLIARAAPHAQVSAVDINPLALRYTAINAALA